MKRNKILFGLVALCLAFGLVISVSAFKSKKDVHQYQYISSSTLAADILDISNWQEVDANTPSCGEAGALVCRYEYEGEMSDFQDFLEDSGTTASLINTNAIAKKQ
ncbi:MAG: hypothetical protein EOO89_17085 [Pedobacter sp.]|nr:MAG: hypothetical protein EOO89_17085 [Pedobacter sp.]